ncbi:MAG TPA: hypothetical protein VLS45_04110 [Methylomicrobium sp.]|nr:hypothetical protein [Methylomicrobium sp.]
MLRFARQYYRQIVQRWFFKIFGLCWQWQAAIVVAMVTVFVLMAIVLQ